MAYADLARLLDPDIRYGDRKSQFNADLDPHWRVALHHNLGSGPWGDEVYQTRGTALAATASGGPGFIQTKDGIALGLTAGSHGQVCPLNTGAFWPNQTRGAFVLCFRATYASGSPPTTNTNILEIGDVTGGTWLIQACNDFSGTMEFGWYNNGTDTRVSCSNSSRWASGDLVTIGFDYSPTGTRAYIKGVQVASTATAPSTFDQRGANTHLGIGCGGQASTPAHSWQSPLLYMTILDRELDVREWGYIQQNPLSWMFAPSALSQPFLAAIAAAAARQYAVTVVS
jgi:hypothetical protein